MSAARVYDTKVPRGIQSASFLAPGTLCRFHASRAAKARPWVAVLGGRSFDRYTARIPKRVDGEIRRLLGEGACVIPFGPVGLGLIRRVRHQGIYAIVVLVPPRGRAPRETVVAIAVSAVLGIPIYGWIGGRLGRLVLGRRFLRAARLRANKIRAWAEGRPVSRGRVVRSRRAVES